MKWRGAEFTIAFVVICMCPAVPSQVSAQNAPPPSPGTLLARGSDKQNPLPANESSIAVGKALYGRECLSCHGPIGKGDGPKADTLKTKPADLSSPAMGQQSDGTLYSKIIEGKTPMPSFRSQFSRREVWSLVNYIRTLGPGDNGANLSSANAQPGQTAAETANKQAAQEHPQAESTGIVSKQKSQAWAAPAGFDRKKNPVDPNETSIAEGKELYQQECLTCHGVGGKGDGRKAHMLEVTPADLTSQRIGEQSDGALFWKINEGKPPMPSFRLRFSAHEVWRLVNYIHSLAPQGALAGSLASKSQRDQRALKAAKGQGGAELGTAQSGGSNSSQAPRTLKAEGSNGGVEPGPTNFRTTVGNHVCGLPPEYFHVLINPLPIYGLAMAVLVLAGAMVLRNRPAQLLGLGLVVLSAASSWPTYLAGEKAYHRVYALADEDGQERLDSHRQRAEKLVYLFYTLTAVALSAVLVPLKAPKTAFPLALLTLVVALASLAAGGWIAKAGGQIRHPEFRSQANAPPHHR